MFQINKTRTPCTAWKHIFDLRYLLQKDIIWIRGNLQNINFCFDHWMEDSPLRSKIMPNPTHLSIENAKVSDFIIKSKQWNTNILNKY